MVLWNTIRHQSAGFIAKRFSTIHRSISSMQVETRLAHVTVSSRRRRRRRRLVFSVSRYNRITPLLMVGVVELPEHIEYKLAVLVYRYAYTGQLRRTLLRNSIRHLLTRLVSVSALRRHHHLLSHAPVFQPSAIELFQSLLPDCGTLLMNVTSASSISVFRKYLKTHLFSHSFPESHVVHVQ